MIIAFGIIGLLLLLLIFFVLRTQNLQKELTLSRHSNKQSNSKANYAYRNLVLVTEALEKNLTQRLQSLYKSRLITQEQHNSLLPLMTCFASIVMNCCEKGDTLEESLKKVLTDEDPSLEGIQLVVKELPSNLRMLWSKNTADSFIAFCQAVTTIKSGDASENSVPTQKAS